MNNSMISAMVSMGGIQHKLDTISDNMANSNTIGYKSKKSSFEDLLTKVQSHEPGMKQAGRATPLGFTLGWGSRMSGITEDMTQGSLKTTDVPTDLALEGNALFEIALDDKGNRAWTRDGSFKLSLAENDASYGYLTTNQGQMVLKTDGTPIAIPNGYHMKIDATGLITAAMPDGSDPMGLGYIKVVEPKQPHLLKQTDNNLYVLPDGTAAAAANTIVSAVNLADPANAKKGIAVRQGTLEQSNVNLADEMVDLMQVQRAYQLMARALTSSDTMMGLANNLRG